MTMNWRHIQNSPMIVLSAMLATLVALAVLLGKLSDSQVGNCKPLVILCAAGIRAPVEAVAKEYERENGVPVHFQYGPSQTLLAQAELSSSGDLYLPGDDSYIEMERQKNLIDHAAPLARMFASPPFVY